MPFRPGDANAPGADLPWERLTALVLGGTGMIGRHVVDALLGRGVHVRALVRPSSRSRNLDGLPVDRRPGDQENAEELARALDGCDLLFHCASPYPRSHFHARRQVDAARASIRSVLQVARAQVPETLLRLPPGRLAVRAVEQAQGTAGALRLQPGRREELGPHAREPQRLEEALAGRLNASLHPPLAEVWQVPGLKRLVYVSSLTTIARPHGRDLPWDEGAGNGARRQGSELPGPPDRIGPAPLATEADRYDKLRSPSPYFAMKDEMEAEVTRAAVEGMPAVIVNPSLCVDAWDAQPTTGKLLLAVAQGMPFYLPGKMNVVATRDVAEAMVNAVALGRTGQRYILGTENTTARAFLSLVARVAGVPPPAVPLPVPLAQTAAWITEVANLALRRPWPALPMSGVEMLRLGQWYDTTLAHEELRMPVTPIETAVTDALDWLRENGYGKRRGGSGR